MKKRHHLVLAIAAAGLVLAGCGSSGSGANGDGVGKPADTSLTEANFITTITAAQKKAKTSHIAMTIDASGQKIKADGEYAVGATAADAKAALKMDLSSLGVGNIEVRLLDQNFYLNFGPMSNNKFAKIDLTDKSNPIAKQYGGLVDQLDPAKQLGQFKKALKSVKKKGAAVSIDGVEAQPYELVVDTTQLEGLGSLGGLGTGAGAKLPDSLTYTMFVGPDNLPRRLVSDAAGSQVTVDYSKWGESVDIKAPSKDEITDSSMLDQLGKAPA